jgi:hypothetical protein
MVATAAYGAQLQVGDGATPTEAFTTIGGVKDISGPAASRDIVETTSHDAEDGFETHVATIKRSGEVTFDINWDPTDATHDQDTGLLGLVHLDEPTNFRLIYARIGYQWDFAGWVTQFSTGAPVADVHTASITIKITGAPVLTESAS